MRITAAGLRSSYPITSFAAGAASSRAPQLGLRYRVAPQITPGPESHARVPLLAALRSAARGPGGPQRNGPQRNGRTSAGGGLQRTMLHRADSITWSQPTDFTAYRPRPRSAAPWRG